VLNKIAAKPFYLFLLEMDKVKPFIEDSLERINRLSNEEKIAGAVGIASLIVLTGYLTKSSRKVLNLYH
jgi:hypothetical protein